VVLDEGRDHDGGRLVEVYDHPQPPPGIQVSPVETLATGRRVALAMVRTANGVEDCVAVSKHPLAAAGEVTLGSLIENDAATIRICGCSRLGRQLPP
jgi:hypothetical protein